MADTFMKGFVSGIVFIFICLHIMEANCQHTYDVADCDIMAVPDEDIITEYLNNG